MEPNYIKPTSDIFIQFLFGKEENSDLLLSFINAVHLDSGFPLIETVEVKNPFNIRNFSWDKETILDVKAVDQGKRIYDIEVQLAGSELFKARSLYYWARLYASQLETADKYPSLKPTICINILNFTLFHEIDSTHTCFFITEKNHPEYILTDHIIMHFIELKKESINQPMNAFLKKWVDYLNKEGKEEQAMKILIKDDPIMEKAHREYQVFSQDEKMRELYEARMKYLRDYNTDIFLAEQRGEEKGIEKGIEKGKLEAAQRMLQKGYPQEDVLEVTGLSYADIKEQ